MVQGSAKPDLIHPKDPSNIYFKEFFAIVELEVGIRRRSDISESTNIPVLHVLGQKKTNIKNVCVRKILSEKC